MGDDALGTVLGGIRNQKKNQDLQNHSTFKINENTWKSLRDLKRLTVTQTSVFFIPVKTGVKNTE